MDRPKASPFRCYCAGGNQLVCDTCRRLAGSLTDREFKAAAAQLAPAPRPPLPDDAPLPDRFLMRLGHEFHRNPEFWCPILESILTEGAQQ